MLALAQVITSATISSLDLLQTFQLGSSTIYCTMTVISCLQFFCHDFQLWLISDHQKEILKLGWVHSNLVSDGAEQPCLFLHCR